MLYLTKSDEEKTKFLVNHRKILTVEKTVSGTSNIYMDNGKIYTVIEKEKEINKKIEDYEVNIIKTAIQQAKKV